MAVEVLKEICLQYEYILEDYSISQHAFHCVFTSSCNAATQDVFLELVRKVLNGNHGFRIKVGTSYNRYSFEID